MKRSDLFMFYKILWEMVGLGSIVFAVLIPAIDNELLTLAGVAILWAILMKMEEGE